MMRKARAAQRNGEWWKGSSSTDHDRWVLFSAYKPTYQLSTSSSIIQLKFYSSSSTCNHHNNHVNIHFTSHFTVTPNEASPLAKRGALDIVLKCSPQQQQHQQVKWTRGHEQCCWLELKQLRERTMMLSSSFIQQIIESLWETRASTGIQLKSSVFHIWIFVRNIFPAEV